MAWGYLFSFRPGLRTVAMALEETILPRVIGKELLCFVPMLEADDINQSINNPTFTQRIEEKASERRSGFSLEFFASCAWTKRPCF